MLQFLLSPFFGLIEGFWRRWFGGYFEHHTVFPKWINKIFESRGTQTIFNILFLTCVFMINSFWITTPLCSFLINLGISKWIIALIIASIFQFMFWSKGHGPAFDMARGGKPSESTIERYHREKWSFIADKLIPEDHWYGFLYDFVWMTARYTYGVIFIIPFLWSLKILWLGLIIASIYALCWTIQEKDNWVFKYFLYNCVESSTNLAEIIGGFSVGLFLTVM